MSEELAEQIIESLRKGIPPEKGVELYSVGNEKLFEGIQLHHLAKIKLMGKIRFVSGSWGNGKTHFFRIIRDMAFAENCAVSNVELSVNEAPLNKFEKVFYRIVRNISTKKFYDDQSSGVIPFGDLIEESLRYLGNYSSESINHEQHSKAIKALMADKGIDIDFKKMIQHYWNTYLPESADNVALEQQRAEILQWFSGEGAIGAYRKRFQINKMINKENSKLMLQSLVEFIKLAGYNGLVILFDEAEQSYSIMRKSALRDAQNNLLHLINSIEIIPGIFMIYATTSDFFVDPKHGIVGYGALSGRIGMPEDKPPKAVDIVWNLDAVTQELKEYQTAAIKIRNIYLEAMPESSTKIASESDTKKFVEELFKIHPTYGSLKFWRVLVTAVIKKYDAQTEGEKTTTEGIHHDVMDQLREE